MATSSSGGKLASATDSYNKDNLTKKWLPRRIILVRHGESSGNLDEAMYERTPDSKIQLSLKGIEQAQQAGEKIIKLLATPKKQDWKVFFYVSPYARTKSTLREIGRPVPKTNLIGVKEECRIREQDFGNFQDKKMADYKKERNEFSRFYYRFPQGESGADIYDRVSGFLETLWRDIELQRFPHDPEKDELNLVIVTHGLSIRIFLMKWFGWTVDQYEQLRSPKNCEYRVMELGAGGEYSLTINHDDETLKEGWGLSLEMIQDQKNRQLGIVEHKEKDEHSKFFGFPEQQADGTNSSAPTVEEAEAK